MTLTLPPYAEKIVSDYLRSHPAIVELEARVVGKTPRDTETPWVKLTQLDAPAVGGGVPDHLVEFYLQLDCYAGSEGGQPEANLLARTVRAAIAALDRSNHQVLDAVITGAKANSGPRIPDEDFKDARERFVVTATIWMHPV